jgi:exonuclease SbcC
LKNYPYIFSLSTVGLINHYNCDYLFNRTRTDFTGDSGSGKSMIADLLQLAFVGSAVFVAATETIKEKRETSGMVLNDKKRGYGGKGYVFLNIAISSTEYLVMGMYLEGSTNYSRPFIVHKGFDLENPTFLTKPILHKDFLASENILPIEDLKVHLKGKEYNCEALQMPSYHKFLFKQNIVPFDLADNPEKLKTYALIIRSFSRGKGFKFDTEHLQDFLFGVEKEKEILANYDKGVESVKNSLSEGLIYQEQINLLKEKKGKLKNLIDLEKIKVDYYKKHLHNSYLYWRFKETNCVSKLTSYTEKLSLAVLESALLEQLDNAEQIKKFTHLISSIKVAQEGEGINKRLVEQEKLAKEKFLEADECHTQVELINDLLPKFNNSIDKLEAHYTQQTANLKENNDLDEFKVKLTTKNIHQEFSKSEWSKNFQNAKDNYDLKIIELQKEIDNLKALLKFSNIEDKESTAYWAINRTKAFSIEEESVLIKLQELIVSEPKDKSKKYLPAPELLFENIAKVKDDKDGFWINLNGIQEYITYATKQFLNNSDPVKKKKFFTEKFANANKDLIKVEKEKNEKETFFRKLNSISGLEESIELYQRQSSILKFEAHDALDIAEDKFNEYLHNYTQKEKVEQEYTAANEAWTKANGLLSGSNEKIEAIKGIKDVPKYLQETTNRLNIQNIKKDDLSEKVDRLVKALKCDNKTIKKTEKDLQSGISDSTMVEVTKQKATNETTLREERKNLKRTYFEAKKQIFGLKLQFESNLFALPDEIENNNGEIKLDEALKVNYDEAYRKYAGAYEAFLDLYLVQDKYKYEKDEDWRKLARATLPEVFKNTEITEEQFTSEIDERLDKIIEQNTIIGDRKIQTLISIFDQVENTFSHFSEEVNRLKNFFSGNDKRITGGYKVALRLEPSQEYPIKWITEFKKQIRQETINRTGLFKIVDDNIDFKDIIQKVFRECGGKKQDPKLKDLLNPKRYFDLNFKLEKENVSNTGSSGQVYSAIALLCIARISLIEKDEKVKENKGIRFMPIDEAEGLGSNYEMLSNIAKSEDYQIISMSINPVGEFEEGSHYIYMLNEPEDEELRINGDPFAQFTEEGITENLQEYIYERYDR